MSLMECLEKANLPKNQTILDNFIRAHKIVNDTRYNNIMCSISGGSDSDIMLDIISKVDEQKKVKYVWFDTGLESQATKDHLLYLEQKYNIKIERERAIKPIPLTCKEYGQPFISKYVSEMMGILQIYGFKWEDSDFETLVKRYCKVADEKCRGAICLDGVYYVGCIGSLKWWCNCKTKSGNRFDISYNKYLKEFIIANPPTFTISNKCCDFAKKRVSKNLVKNQNVDLMIIGVRKAEGGARASAYKNCFSEDLHGCAQYRPLFFYLDIDKLDYEKSCNIVHSDCYKVWGFNRTGCVGCPYNIKLFEELHIINKYEPKLYKAVNNIFKDSYEYTKQYRQFVQDMKLKEKGIKKLF